LNFDEYSKNIAETKQHMSTDISSSAFFSMTQAEHATGEIKQKVVEGSMVTLSMLVLVLTMAGVKLPVFIKIETSAVEAFVASMDQNMLTILNGMDNATAELRG
jgi:hypothetical protein